MHFSFFFFFFSFFLSPFHPQSLILALFLYLSHQHSHPPSPLPSPFSPQPPYYPAHLLLNPQETAYSPRYYRNVISRTYLVVTKRTYYPK